MSENPVTLTFENQNKVLQALARTFTRENHVLTRHPDLLWQQVYNRLQWEPKEVFSIAEHQILTGKESERNIWFKIKTPYRQSEALGRILQGHTDHVQSCCYSPDGEKIISSGNDNKVIVWNANNGEQLFVLLGVVSAVSPNGQWIAVARGKEIQIYDLNTGIVRSMLECQEGTIRVCSFSTDSTYLLTGSSNLMLQLWDIKTCKSVLKIKNQYMIDDCSISPDGKLIISTGQFYVYVWRIDRGNLIRTLKGHLAKVLSCKFSPDGNFILATKDDGVLSLFNTFSGQEVKVFEGHSDRVYGSAFSPDSKMICSASDDKTIRFWDIDSGEPIRYLEGHTHWVTCCAFSPDGKKVVTGSADKTIQVWDLSSSSKTHKHKSHPDRVRTCVYSPDGRTIASSGGDSTVQLWNADTGESLDRLVGHQELEISDCAFSSDGRHLVSAGWDGTLRTWNLEKKILLRTLEGHTGSGYSVDGRLIIGSVNTCGFSPDDSTIVSGGRDGTVRLWNAGNGKLLRVLKDHSGDVLTCGFSPDGNYLVSAGRDKYIILWDAISGKQKHKWTGHSDQITKCVFSPDGLNLISSSWDQTIRIWNLPNGELVKELKGHTSWVEDCCYTPDGRYIVSAGWDTMIAIWDAYSGQIVRQIFLPGSFHSLDLHPWKTELVCGDSGGAMYQVEILGLQYGALITTASQKKKKNYVRCPACQTENFFDDESYGKRITCSNNACGRNLQINNFIPCSKSNQFNSLFSRNRRY